MEGNNLTPGDEFFRLPPGFVGIVSVFDPTLVSNGFYAFSLRYSGTSFTSVPVSECGFFSSIQCP